jgi:hypothetical protein
VASRNLRSRVAMTLALAVGSEIPVDAGEIHIY